MDDQDMGMGWNVHHNIELRRFSQLEEDIAKAKENLSEIREGMNKRNEKNNQLMYSLLGFQHQISIYGMFAEIKNWESLVETAAGISIEKQRRMIGQSGLINEKIKLKMLDYWMNKHAGNQEKGSLIGELIGLAEEFMGRKAKSGAFRNRNFKFISRIVSAAILDEDWLEFSRTKLELSDKEIENVIERYGEFSDEFKYHIIKMLQQEKIEDSSWQKWELQQE